MSKPTRDELVRDNLGLVGAIAKGYRGRGLDYDDLVGEGRVGLVIAADRFDPMRGEKFAAFAGACIRTEIRKAIGNTGSAIRLPIHTHKLLARWNRAANLLRAATGVEPGADEVADAMGLSVVQRRIVMQARHARLPEPSRVHLESIAAPEGAAIADDERADLCRRLGRLSDPERAVVSLRYGLGGGEPMSQKAVGGRLGVSAKWVWVVEGRALRKLA